MIIANPIFDTVFKRLMENNRVARFFVETLIDEPVTELIPIPQEYTYYKGKIRKKRKSRAPENPEDFDILSVIRFDFVASIRTADGEHKKVLIEIQKSQKAADLMRFRTYLGEQYKRMDVVEKDGKKVEVPLPIISIYLLGFKLTETSAIAIKVNRTYNDLIAGKVLHLKSPLIESLTHDSYVVQIPRIVGKTRTSLEKMLTIFEQKYFIDEKGILKEYSHDVKDDDNLYEMVGILQHTAADPKEKRDIEEEWWMIMREAEQEQEIAEREKKIAKQEGIITEQEGIIAEQEGIIAERDAKLAEKNKETRIMSEEIRAMKEMMEKMQKELERLKK